MITSTKNHSITVLVFKTNIRFRKEARRVGLWLEEMDGLLKWNVDLEDCDKVLRIEALGIAPEEVIYKVKRTGFECEELTF